MGAALVIATLLIGAPGPRAPFALTVPSFPPPDEAHGRRPEGLVVFAGGWGPESNQASIERDAARLVELLGRERVLLLFGGGGAGRTVQTATRADAVTERLGLVFGRRDALAVAYRAPILVPDGAATRDRVEQALRALASRPGGGVAFGAGHGGPPSPEGPASLELWGGALDAPAIAEALDASDARGSVALVLGHCHSGAFADLVYQGADPSRPLASPARCVLAAVPRELEAAGCSPDAEDPEARAFLHTVAEALAVGADYDADGSVGLDEALAYARIHDETVDVPVRSSDIWLEAQQSGGPHGLEDAALSALLAQADPAEAAVLVALGEPDASPTGMVRHLDRLVAEAQALDAEVERAEAELEEARQQALGLLLERWPELANPYHPTSRRLLSGSAQPVMGLLDDHPDRMAALEARDRAWASRIAARWALERRIARLDRWVRTARSVWARTGLSGAARRKLDLLRACESRPVLPTRPIRPEGGRGGPAPVEAARREAHDPDGGRSRPAVEAARRLEIGVEAGTAGD